MSCLFNSLSRFVNEDAKLLRHSVCEYLATTQELAPGVPDDVLFEGSKQEYIARMRKEQTWGGAVEIQAFCQMYNAKVTVDNVRGSGVSGVALNEKLGVVKRKMVLRSGVVVFFRDERGSKAPEADGAERQIVFTNLLAQSKDIIDAVSASDSSGSLLQGSASGDTYSLEAVLTWNGFHYEPVI
mmetsp:Transcript_25639/g.36154  ORF Transcript_25639/g.36154 Transcript_25639/m.36154 type:complete len:184 (+) Transcript_25639:3187-3738(+)|eukprot:CAMPEP_0175094770 /NCGR_PEP_ID=MMETSP0086_2-20121207/3780_1 /TAXON_ID=136419 /ORGANISM="Unknown Unknown, Strain D1" /LENGTH=183 /DNA_ID=CAMNT_0016367935 /DNA_START=1495 /DNA_END=2046 /DNA_ORIENTATION=-